MISPAPLLSSKQRPRRTQPRSRMRGLLAAAVILLTCGVSLTLTGSLSMAAPAESVTATTSAAEASTQAIVAFDAANKLYELGKFAEAAAAYQQLIQSGHQSVTLFFNQGNAWFKAGQTGRAIAAYRHAERLAPRDPNVRFNLTFARKRVTGGDPPAPPLLDRLLTGMTLNEWTFLAAAGLWLTLLLLAGGELRTSFRPAARRYALLTATLTVLLSAGVAGAARRWSHPQDGVVIVSSAIARSGPLEDAKVLHQLRDGTELKIVDQKHLGGEPAQVWFQVRTVNGDTGWIRDDQLMVIQARPIGSR
jgi:hypothetical protein